MNVIESYLHHALAVSPGELFPEIRRQIASSPFAQSMMPRINELLSADPELVSELWKFSVSLNIPHKLLFDAYQIQIALNQQQAFAKAS